MASRATRSGATFADYSHLGGELTAMWILMTGLARQIYKLIFHRSRGFPRSPNLMTFVAGNRFVRARQRKPGGLMACESKCRRLKSFGRVTILAAVTVRLAEEVALVHIRMAGHTPRAADSEDGVLSLGRVTLPAGNSGVTIDKRVRRRLVAFHGKSGFLETSHSVAAGAVSSICKVGKLSFVRIDRVTVNTVLVRNRFFEICFLVARIARQLGMLCLERI